MLRSDLRSSGKWAAVTRAAGRAGRRRGVVAMLRSDELRSSDKRVAAFAAPLRAARGRSRRAAAASRGGGGGGGWSRRWPNRSTLTLPRFARRGDGARIEEYKSIYAFDKGENRPMIFA
jgi:hypothetical protein